MIETVLTEAAFAPLLRDMAPTLVVHGFDECQTDGPAHDPGDGVLVQFTSGTSADARGVPMTIDRLSANIDAIIAVLDPRPGDVSATWLPLGHDMGLVGMALTSLAAGGPRWVNGGSLVLMRPEDFLASPASWMAACSRHGATITAGPDFAYATAARTLAGRPLDLSRLRAAIVGSEPVRAETLERFTRAASPHGFETTAFCPAYGLAEVGVAATMVPPSCEWTVDTTGDRPLVGCGPPIPGMEVTIDDSGRIGLRGGSVAEQYSDGSPITETDGVHRTNDLGFLSSDDLYVAGRADDVIVVAGQKHHAWQLQDQLTSALTGRARDGGIAVAQVDAGYAVVAEVQPGAVPDAPGISRTIRAEATGHWGAGPHRIALTPPGAIPKTTSGKIRRQELIRLLEAGALPELA
jgi:acyl-CoA synthetase (AMP-forming)/AMP-acid ligase II